MTKIFTRDKTFYRVFFPLVLTITAQTVIALAVNLADNVMLGAYSETSLAGAALVNQLQFILQQIVSGVGAGVVVIGSQYWGKNEADPIKRVMSLGLKFALMFGVIFWAVTFFAPRQILWLLTSDISVIDAAAEYMRVMCWTYIIFAATNVLTLSLQSVRSAMIGTVMSVVTLFVNVTLNYMLIFGNFGMPRLGITGAAIATLISRILELATIVIYILLIDKKLRFKLNELLRFDFTYLKDYLRAAVPLVLSGAQWGVAQAAQIAILGHISGEAIAANSIAVIIFELFCMLGFSCSSAASVTIGNTVGSGRLDAIKPYSRTLQAIFLVIGLVSGAGIFIFKETFVSLFEVSPETSALAIQFLIVLAVTTVGTCYEYPVESGIIGGGGNTKYAGIVDITFMWIFTLPVSALSAFVWELPPVVTFCFLKADQILKCIPNAIYCNSYKWVRKLTRD
ncbi:MAG: MATE family efflux transporter [Oscillospiraceae bacterium]|jgi:putative MATE family efflux protein|nr:MATE family efflux transporter [Oscillospiraceae bacterium]